MLIKNPFTRPVWIERVHVSLPSELMLADNPAERQRLRSERKEAEARRREEFRANARKAAELNESLERLSRLIEDSKKGSPNNASSGLEALSNEVRQLREKMELDNAGELVVRHSSIRNIRLISERLQRIVLQHCNIDEVEVTDRSMQPSGAREINLRSLLPPGVALQPSSTVAYTAELNVDRSIVFPPAKYTLQFSVNFSFVRVDCHRNLEGFLRREAGDEASLRWARLVVRFLTLAERSTFTGFKNDYGVRGYEGIPGICSSFTSWR